MLSAELLITFTIAAIVMNLSPGPSNLYVMARAIAQGARGGVVAAMGLAVGSMVHVIAAVFGLSAVFSHSPTLYSAIKIAGAAYLLYLGFSYLRSKHSGEQQGVPRSHVKPLSTIFRESVIVEITNLKTALFFIALLPQFVVPESGPVTQQLFILGAIVTISALPCDLLVAFCSSKVARWLIQHERAQQIQDRISGSILLSMGAYIVADEVTH